ncbi:MAG: Holliday junction branch migration protein RuvA [Saprospiraceae bacterium]|nr:Holliday junction branch migration protein RuvA [Saprospiraceae bacterium]
MIASLRGKVIRRSPTSVIVECSGVGYEVRISLYTASAIEGKEEVGLTVYHHFSQDHQALFGFTEEAEKQLFIHLISVSGVGPNTAQLILSYMSPQETEIAIMSEDLSAFKKVKGVGDKTARRILIDLKDKVRKGMGESHLIPTQTNNTMEEEALSALLALGFPRAQAQKALSRISGSADGPSSVEALIRQALRALSQG